MSRYSPRNPKEAALSRGAGGVVHYAHPIGSDQNLPASGSGGNAYFHLNQSNRALSVSDIDPQAGLESSGSHSPVAPTLQLADSQRNKYYTPLRDAPANTGTQVRVSGVGDDGPSTGSDGGPEGYMKIRHGDPYQQYKYYRSHSQHLSSEGYSGGDTTQNFPVHVASDLSFRARSEPDTSRSPVKPVLSRASTRDESDMTAKAPPRRRIRMPHETIRGQLAPCQPNSGPPTNPDRDLATRNLCVLALALGWGVSLASLAVGIYIIVVGPIQVPSFLLDRYVTIGIVGLGWNTPVDPTHEYPPYLPAHRVFLVPEAVVIVVSLSFNIGLTAVLDGINLIHATALRWALWHDGRPLRSCNLRLFTFSKHHLPNKWPFNIVSGIGLIFAYGGITLFTFNVYLLAKVEVRGDDDGELIADVPGPRYGVDFNAWGMIGVGSGIFLQAAVCTLCLLIKRGSITTWSSNPLAIAKACSIQNTIGAVRHKEASRSEMSSWNSSTPFFRPTASSHRSVSKPACTSNIQLPETPDPLISTSKPKTRQCALLSENPRVRKIVFAIWFFFAIACIAVIIVAIRGQRMRDITSPELQAVEEASGRNNLLSKLQNVILVGLPYTGNPYVERQDWKALLIQSAALSPVLVNLHLLEYLTLLIRDEKIWRRATTRDGVKVDSGALIQSASTWQCWVLFVFKSVVPWVFSYAISCNTAVLISLIPLATLAVLFLMIAVFAEGLIRWEPNGSQPSTYGNIDVLSNLVDDFDHKNLFWGHKGNITDTIGKAGTSGSRLADVDKDLQYIGF